MKPGFFPVAYTGGGIDSDHVFSLIPDQESVCQLKGSKSALPVKG